MGMAMKDTFSETFPVKIAAQREEESGCRYDRLNAYVQAKGSLQMEATMGV